MSNTEPGGRDPLSGESLPNEFEIIGFDDELPNDGDEDDVELEVEDEDEAPGYSQ